MGDAAAKDQTHSGCERAAQAAAYLDGELGEETEAFEAHAKSCPACSAVLLEQRRLLCLLDTAFNETFEEPIKLPRDFARELKARAQTDMSGVRGREERRRALKICAALSIAAFALLGVTAFSAAAEMLTGVAHAVPAFAGVAGHAAADAGAGASLVLRAAGGQFFASSEPIPVLQAAILVGALALLLWLIASYHRSRQRE